MEVCPKFYSRTHGQAFNVTFNVNIYKSFSHSAAGTVVAIDPMTLVLVHRQDFMMQSHHEIANRLRPGDWAWGVSRKSFKTKHVVFISFWHVSTCFNNAPMDPSLIPHISHLPTNPILDPRDIHRGVPRCIATSALLKPRSVRTLSRNPSVGQPEKKQGEEIRVMLQQNPPWN